MDRKLPDISQKTGTLILVTGPSGAGKDTLIDAARRHFGEDGPVSFPRRLITREDQTGENHTPITFSDFGELLSNGLLFLHWEAHGLQYGVSREALDKLRDGHVVILNISRQLTGEAREKWSNTRLVQIKVDEKILLQRLKNRGRESEQSIKSRFARRTEKPANHADHTINNSDAPEKAIGEFIEIVSNYL